MVGDEGEEPDEGLANLGIIRQVVVIRPSRGGVAHTAHRCADQLRSEGVEVTEIVADDDGSAALSALRLALHHRAVLRSADAIHVELGKTTIGAFWSGLIAGLIRPGLIVVLHDGPVMVLAPGSGWIRRAPGRRDAIAHGILAKATDGALRRLFARLVDQWAGLSNRAAQAIADGGLAPVSVVDHGADPPTATLPPSRCGTIVYAGYVAEPKGLDVLVDAWEQIAAESRLRLVVAGESAPNPEVFSAQLRQRLEAPHLRAEWLGRVDDLTFAQVIADAAMVVIPYRQSNPASGILIRAAVEGRAIIGSRVAAVTDFIVDGRTGLVVAPGSSEELAHALRELEDNPEQRDRLGQAAREWAASRCTWEAEVRQMRALYVTERLRRRPLRNS